MRPTTSQAILVTGCASGIGRAVARRLFAEGHRLMVTDVNEPGLAEVAKTEGWGDPARVIARGLDVRDPSAWRAAIEAVVARWGRLDVAMNVAGILVPKWAHDATDQDVDRTIDINAKGLIHGTNAALRQMIAQRAGHVVNVASLAGIVPVPGLALYSASKHAARAYSIAVGQEVRKHGVFVTAVCPTVVDTPMVMNQFGYTLFSGGKEDATRADIEFPSTTLNLLPIPWVDARDISNAVLWLVSDEARYVTGVALPVDAGLCAQPPGIPPAAGELLASLMAD